LPSYGFDLGREITVKPFGVGHEEAKSRLDFLGYNTTLERLGETTAGAEIDIRLSGNIDRVLRRAAAKIAFNYLAYHYPTIPTMTQFAALRRYVRYDEASGHEPVTLSREPMVAGATEECAPIAHAVAVENKSGRVLGHVTLLFRFRYLIVLADGGFLLEPTTVNCGHIFNVDSREILELTRDPARGRRLTPPSQ
jgi:hypothetical protein